MQPALRVGSDEVHYFFIDFDDLIKRKCRQNVRLMKVSCTRSKLVIPSMLSRPAHETTRIVNLKASAAGAAALVRDALCHK